MSFINYLQQLKCSSATIKTYEKYLGYFMQWLQKENLDAALLHYNDLLDYILICIAMVKVKIPSIASYARCVITLII